MKKIVIASFILGGILGANAQTVRLTSATPNTTSLGGNSSVVIGNQAGASITPLTGESVFVGTAAGSQTTGVSNTFVGWASGPSNTTGIYNTFIGRSAGNAYVDGTYSTIIGAMAGLNTKGSNNTFLGFGAGSNITTGTSNICIGPGSGGNIGDIHNQLFIDNSNTSTPLIWGDFWSNQVKMNGKVGVGGVTTFPSNALYTNYSLFVTGGMLADEVRVALSSSGTWADYVFAKDYKLKTLSEVESFIKENGHLPNVPSATQVKEEGINVAQMVTIQQEKIEELTLYIIEQNKRIEALEARMK